jgi:hypothetical protein
MLQGLQMTHEKVLTLEKMFQEKLNTEGCSFVLAEASRTHDIFHVEVASSGTIWCSTNLPDLMISKHLSLDMRRKIGVPVMLTSGSYKFRIPKNLPNMYN